jgi:hypothetical protein
MLKPEFFQNEAEWLIEPFYEYEFRPLDWKLAAGTRSGRFETTWAAANLSWDGAAPGETVAIIESDYRIDLLNADRLCVRLSHADDVQVTLRLRRDDAVYAPVWERVKMSADSILDS